MTEIHTPVLTGAFDIFLLRIHESYTQTLVFLQEKHLTGGGHWQVVRGVRKEIDGKQESVYSAVNRQISFESGLEPKTVYSLGIVNSIYNPQQDVIRMIPVFASVIEGDPEITLSHEHRACEWADLDAARRMLVGTGYQNSIDGIQKFFKHSSFPDSWLLKEP